MRILYVTHYFPPEMGAPAGRVAGLSRLWAAAGHDVHVLTGFPHHPTGRIPAEYRQAFRRGFLRENFHGVTVHRTWIYPAANRGKIRRSLNYGSFLLSASVVGSLRLPRPDVIVATSPQLLCAVAGAVLARRFNAPLVMEVRDLWPESLVAVGASQKASLLVRGLEALAHGLYSRAAHIVTVTGAQREAIVNGGLPGDRVSVIPNGVDREFFDAGGAPPKGSGPFIVTYIGTLGMAHRLETLLDAAAEFRGDSSVCFRIVGEGARRGALESYARQNRLDNVDFIGERPRGEVPRWIAESDVCAVLLRKNEVFRTVVPSKMLEIMAVGRPLLLGVDGEAKRLLERARAGIAIEPENVSQLVAAIRELQRDPARSHALGQNGREFVSHEFLRERLALEYSEILQRLVLSRTSLNTVESRKQINSVPES